MMRNLSLVLALMILPASLVLAWPKEADSVPSLEKQEANTWVKRSPLPGGPLSPRMGYEATIGYDPVAKKLIRWGGHNQGGGGEQNAETWIFDPVTTEWKLQNVNDTAPGVCCGQQNVFDLARGRFVRFASFSGSHGWQWSREIYMKNTSLWSYDLPTNTWRDMRPVPEPRTSPLRCASYDTDSDVIVVFGGEGNSEGTLVYDHYTNTWTRQNPPDQPAFRSGGNMAFDAAHSKHVLFGSQFNNDKHTWAYDLRSNRWTDLKPKEMPPTDRNDAVLTYDPINKVVLALIKVTVGKGESAKSRIETWAFDTGKRQWRKMNPPREPDPSGNRARLFTFLPDHGVALLENRTHPPHGKAEQQIWTYRYAMPKKGALQKPLASLTVKTGKDSARLEWKVDVPSGVKNVHIFRGEGEEPWKVNLQKRATLRPMETTYDDRDLQSGKIYHYTLLGEDTKEQPVLLTYMARTQPPIVEDAVASVLSGNEVELTWTAPKSRDVVGYHVERAVVEVMTEDQLTRIKKQTPPLKRPSVSAVHKIGTFQTLTSKPTTERLWKDKVDLKTPVKVSGKPLRSRNFHKEELDPKGQPYHLAVYAYRIRTVNALGVVSGPSPYVLTIPSAVQSVYSREQGQKCDLKWARNPEKGLKGYRIYRMNGRYSKDLIVRLTPEAIEKTTYTDPEAGKSSRRYHIVAVDALGQEGYPSAPVWFEREWKPAYKPFTQEWHQ